MTTPSRTFLRRLVCEHGTHAYSQETLADAMRAQLSGLPDAKTITQMVGFVYAHSAIERRFLELSLDELDGRVDWYACVNEANVRLSERVLHELFSRDVKAADCQAFIVVSSTYAGFPALSRRLLQPHGFPLEALCFDLTGLGCAGPTHGMALAQLLLEQGSATNVCVLCVDAMGTFGQCRRHLRAPSMAEVVGHGLASDGAAAFVMSRQPGGRLSFETCALTSRLWPDSLDQNDLTADAENQPYLSVGKDIRTRIGTELDLVLDADAVASPLLIHPGGAALMRLLKERYPMLASTADLSMSVLREHGNLGSASLLWVLDRALRREVTLGPCLRLVALGPGIVTTSLRMVGVRTEGLHD